MYCPDTPCSHCARFNRFIDLATMDLSSAFLLEINARELKVYRMSAAAFSLMAILLGATAVIRFMEDQVILGALSALVSLILLGCVWGFGQLITMNKLLTKIIEEDCYGDE